MSDVQQFIISKLEKLDEKLDEVRQQNAAMRAAFDAHTERDEDIHSEVVKLGDSIDRHSQLLDEYNSQLEEHIRRTEILENKVLPLVVQNTEAKTIEKWKSTRMQKTMKTIGWLTSLGGLIIILLEIADKFH